MSPVAESWKRVKERLFSARYVLIVAAVGLLLLLWPADGSAPGEAGLSQGEEARVETILSRIEGVGQAELLLSEKGAVVVCQGADDAGVCLRVTQAVRCYTGLGADKVQIFKMK